MYVHTSSCRPLSHTRRRIIIRGNLRKMASHRFTNSPLSVAPTYFRCPPEATIKVRPPATYRVANWISEAYKRGRIKKQKMILVLEG